MQEFFPLANCSITEGQGLKSRAGDQGNRTLSHVGVEINCLLEHLKHLLVRGVLRLLAE